MFFLCLARALSLAMQKLACPGDASVPMPGQKHLVWTSGCDYRYVYSANPSYEVPWVSGALAVLVLTCCWLAWQLILCPYNACMRAGSDSNQQNPVAAQVESDDCTGCAKYGQALPDDKCPEWCCIAKCHTHVCTVGISNLVIVA